EEVPDRELPQREAARRRAELEPFPDEAHRDSRSRLALVPPVAMIHFHGEVANGRTSFGLHHLRADLPGFLHHHLDLFHAGRRLDPPAVAVAAPGRPHLLHLGEEVPEPETAGAVGVRPGVWTRGVV